jgi:large subunit ribosomal protein L33
LFWPGRQPADRLCPPEAAPDRSPAPQVEDDRKMAKGKKKLEVVHLVCEETGDQNYTLRRKTGGEKLKLKKFSPRLRKHTVHVEKRK